MPRSFFEHHLKNLVEFCFGLLLVILFITVPELQHILGKVGQLGYPGMFFAGIMYGSGLTAPIATVIFVDSPQHFNPMVIGLLGGLGAALYDLCVFLFTRHKAEHGWLASVLSRIRQRHTIPNWVTLAIGTLILASPLPDELAAGLFGIAQGKAKPFFLLSFASSTIGIFLLSGLF